MMTMECEVYVEVTVSGSEKQLHTYMNWLSKSPECQYRGSYLSDVNEEALFLTNSHVQDTTWSFSSSNIKNKIKVARLRKRKKLQFTVNYSILKGMTMEEIKQFKSIYQTPTYLNLVDSFNPMPLEIFSKCPDLDVKTEWGSYFIEDKPIITKHDDPAWTYHSF